MQILAADWVIPISAAPIPRGAVVIEKNKIAAIGAQTEIAAEYRNVEQRDFGAAAILPGFVNAHAHLELTALRGYLDSVENDFFAWLRKLTAARAERMTINDILASTVCGAIEAARAGITTVGDIATDALYSLDSLQTVGLRGIAFQEVINPDSNAAKQTMANLRRQISNCRHAETDRVTVGVSPHAPYSVSGELFKLVAKFAVKEKLLISIHAAESLAETEFVQRGNGVFADFLEKRGIGWNAPGVSTVRYLERIGVLRAKPLLAHCVRVDDADLEIIKATDSSVAHCPRSNSKFGHGIAPLAKFLNQDLRVGLGSDSVASNNVGDVLEEARFAALLARANGDFVDARAVLHLATLGGAAALGLDDETGSLEPGKQADLAVISLGTLRQQPIYDPFAAVVFASTGRDVVLTMVAGQTIYENDTVLTVDENDWQTRLSETAAKIAAAGENKR